MTLTEKIALATVAITLLGGVFYMGRLDGRIDGLDPDAIRNAQKTAEAEIDKKTESALNELKLLPRGTVLAYVGLNVGSNQEAPAPAGWVPCGEKGTPNLNGRYLVGTNHAQMIGEQVGSLDHTHSFTLNTVGEKGRRSREYEGANNKRGDPNWNHTHKVKGEINRSDNRPLSTKVLFFCKE